MEFTLKEKLMLAIKSRKHEQNFDPIHEFNGETLVILPENDIAFEMAQLFLHKTNDSVSFLLKDSISSFYSDKIINNSIQV